MMKNDKRNIFSKLVSEARPRKVAVTRDEKSKHVKTSKRSYDQRMKDYAELKKKSKENRSDKLQKEWDEIVKELPAASARQDKQVLKRLIKFYEDFTGLTMTAPDIIGIKVMNGWPLTDDDIAVWLGTSDATANKEVKKVIAKARSKMSEIGFDTAKGDVNDNVDPEDIDDIDSDDIEQMFRNGGRM